MAMTVGFNVESHQPYQRQEFGLVSMDADSEKFLQELNKEPVASPTHETIRELQKNFEPTLTTNSPLVIVSNIEIEGPHRPIQLRLFKPANKDNVPVLVFFHGGGWAFGDLDEYHSICQFLCEKSDCLIVAVNYGLAPAFKFPKPLDDCYTATKWVVKNIKEHGGNPKHLAVGGDSAGGNLAAALTLMAKEKKDLKIDYQILITPALNNDFETASFKKFGKDYYLTTTTMQFFWENYFEVQEDCLKPYACPVKAIDLQELPSALVVLASFDPLSSEGVLYADKLQANSVPTEIMTYPTFHAFINFDELKIGQEALEMVADKLKTFFAHKQITTS